MGFGKVRRGKCRRNYTRPGDNDATKNSRVEFEKTIKLKLTGSRGDSSEGVIKMPHARLVISSDNRGPIRKATPDGTHSRDGRVVLSVGLAGMEAQELAILRFDK